MLNIDTRLLSRVDSNEMWFLLHLSKRINTAQRVCWPSNKTLCKDTGWHIEKVQKVKKSLVDKGLIAVELRPDRSNLYRIRTSCLGVYLNMDSFEFEESEPIGNSDIGRGVDSSIGRGVKSDNEVLATEVLATEGISSPDGEAAQTPLFQESPSKSQSSNKKAARPKNEDFPEYTAFIEKFNAKYPNMLTFPRDGAKVKSLIRQCRQQLANRGKDPTPEHVVAFWEIFVGNLEKTWAHGRTLSTIDSNLNAIIFELEHGKKQTDNDRYNARTAAQRYVDNL